MMPATAAEDSRVVYDTYCAHNSGLRIHTDTVVQASLISQYPSHGLISTTCDLIAYANAGHAIATLNEDVHPTLRSCVFEPTARQPADGTPAGKLVEAILFGRFDYVWQDHKFHVFVVDGQNNLMGMCDRRCYVLSPLATVGEKDQLGREAMEALVLSAGIWSERSHDQVWVYDQGRWSKNKELWRMIQGGSWKDLILDEGTERSILRDVIGFFDARETYAELGAPWKVGRSRSWVSSLCWCVFSEDWFSMDHQAMAKQRAQNYLWRHSKHDPRRSQHLLSRPSHNTVMVHRCRFGRSLRKRDTPRPVYFCLRM